MNKQVLNSLFKQINIKEEAISNLMIQIDEEIKLLSEKEKRNYEVFTNRFSDLLKKENEIKNLMDNKHFSFIKFIDFLSSEEVYETKNFSVNEKSGYLHVKQKSRTPFIDISKMISQNKKEIVFTINKGVATNEIEFSFFSITGIPLVPKSVVFIEGEEEIPFYEPNFRYYNRNENSTFVSNFHHYPRIINKIKFYFEEPVNDKNFIFNIYQNSYNTDSNSYASLNILNPKKLSAFNITKTTDETVVPLEFEYSNDGLIYKELLFDNRNIATIFQESPSDFNIRIKTNYENAKLKEQTETVTESIQSSNIIKSTSVYKLNENISIEDYEIIFPFSAKKDIEEICESYELDFENYIHLENGVWKLKKEFINKITETTLDQTNMKFFDDFSILKENSSYFNFYLNTNTMELFAPGFINNVDFYIQHSYKKVKENYNIELFTPSIFDISIKG